jgi:hypothetical protein
MVWILSGDATLAMLWVTEARSCFRERSEKRREMKAKEEIDKTRPNSEDFLFSAWVILAAQQTTAMTFPLERMRMMEGCPPHGWGLQAGNGEFAWEPPNDSSQMQVGDPELQSEWMYSSLSEKELIRASLVCGPSTM